MAQFWCNDMRNYINRKLVEARGIGDTEVAELQFLHYIAESIVLRVEQEVGEGSPRLAGQVAEAYEAMKFVEYEMQKRWGFPLAERYHTHTKRLGRVISGETETWLP